MIECVKTLKYGMQIWTEVAKNVYDSLHRIVILERLILPIQEDSIFSHFLKFSSVSFVSYLKLLWYESLTYSVVYS